MLWVNSSWESKSIEVIQEKKLFSSTCVQMYAWFSIFLLHFELSLSAENLKGSVNLNFLLVSVIELPAILSTIYFPDRFGRKKTAILSIFIGSFTCITVAFYQQIVSLAMIGKFFVSISMYTMFSWSVELYQTKVRGEAFGLLNIFARIGSAAWSSWSEILL